MKANKDVGRWTASMVVVFAIYAGLPTFLGLEAQDPAIRFFPPYQRFFNDADHLHLGAEYWNVAQSIAIGRGFSSPFEVPSGATAWVPPVLPYLLAALSLICGGDPFWVAVLYMLINTAVFAWVFHDLITHSLGNLSPWVGYIAAACVLIANFQDNFQRTHDGTLLLALFHAMVNQATGRYRFSYALWGITGGDASLLSPAIVLVWIVLSVSLYLRPNECYLQTEKARKVNVSIGFIAAGFIAVSIQSPWLVRNYIEFGKFVPIKSNGLFELEQSLLRDDDGVLDFHRDLDHPFSSLAEATRHAEIGELEYIEERSRRLEREFWPHFGKYLADCLNRTTAATLVYCSISLHQENLYWTTFKRIVYALPWLFFLFSLIVPERLTQEQRIWLVAGITYLLPYLLLSYYNRYMIPLMGLRCLLMLWGIQRFSVAWQARRLGIR